VSIIHALIATAVLCPQSKHAEVASGLVAGLFLKGPWIARLRDEDERDLSELLDRFKLIARADNDEIESAMILALEQATALGSPEPEKLLRNLQTFNEFLFAIPAERAPRVVLKDGKVVRLKGYVLRMSAPIPRPITEFRQLRRATRRRG
jgi:hypothetical protein